MCRVFWLKPNRLFATGRFFVCLICFMVLHPAIICASPVNNCKKLLPENITCYQHASSHAQSRLAAFRLLVAKNQNRRPDEKLQAVNLFFNQFSYLKDERYEGVTDYWKTPAEFIMDGAGDSEDFAMAKYFTLRALNIPAKTLRIAYVKSLALNQSHMILAYYSTPFTDPLILDNLSNTILPASKRDDLQPVYSFDGEGLWFAKQRGQST